MKKKKVLIGLSGGVDSAVAAHLLLQEGYEVVGGFMRNWDALANNDTLGNPTLSSPICPQEMDYQDAMQVAEKLGIPLLRIDFVKEYWDAVFSHFLEEYKKGRTPNPDIFCNKHIKFESFRLFAKANGFDFIATGHYAKRGILEGKITMEKSKDRGKDQTYFLSQVNQTQLEDCLFPLGDITKNEVRQIAKALTLSVASKKDSTGVCFIGERNFKEFLKNYLPAKKGDIIDSATGKKVGEHEGVLYYTLGQRRGLGIGGIKGTPVESWFVTGKDVKTNRLFVAQGEENTYLLSDAIDVNTVNWLGEERFKEWTPMMAKFRYRQEDLPVEVRFVSFDAVEVRFPKPYKAVTPGQAAVFYVGDRMVGGGIIETLYYQGKEKKVF